MEDPRRRIGTQVLILNQAGNSVLLVHPTYRADWTLPGGDVAPGEPIITAARRVLFDRIGLDREISHGLLGDQVPYNSNTGTPERISIVCDGGRMSVTDAAALSVPINHAPETRALEWVPIDLLPRYTEPYIERRIRAAVASIALGHRFPLLYLGEPVTVVV
ncbi:NUDIX domain-containing protein [Kitasatospora misakiensis]|uniref:NUDIX domain-containing protein n=1 Tax=Kitasatospora misakiensis TaxID=67330 RepID=A0ABW0X1Q3_9ACTN